MSKVYEKVYFKKDPLEFGIYHEFFPQNKSIYMGTTDRNSDVFGIGNSLVEREGGMQYVEMDSIKSVTDFISANSDCKNPRYKASDNREDTAWAASDSLDHALDIAVNGDKKMLNEIVKLSENKTAEIIKKYADKEVGVRRDVEGTYLDVGLYMQNEPEAFYNTQDEPMPDKFLHIDVDACYNSGVSSTTVRNNIVNLITAVTILESIGHRVSIDCYWLVYVDSSNPSAVFKYKLKAKTQQLNINSLVSVMHPSFFRRISFRLQELFNCITYGYGRPATHEFREKENIIAIEKSRSVEDYIKKIKQGN